MHQPSTSKGIDDLEIATAEYIDWFNHRRLHGEIDLIPPAEHETNHYRPNHASAGVADSSDNEAVSLGYGFAEHYPGAFTADRSRHT